MSEQTEEKNQVEGVELKGIAIFNELETGLENMKEEYSELPDVSTKAGYLIVKDNIKKYREIKKSVEDKRKSEGRILLDAKGLLDDKAKEIMVVVDETFQPHITARKEEDDRLKQIKIDKELVETIRRKVIAENMADLKQYFIDAIGKTASEIDEKLEELANVEVTEETFEEFEPEAKAIRDSLIVKLKELYNTTYEQEAAAIQLKKGQDELKAKQEEQRVKDEAKAEEDRLKEEADRKANEEENARIKAENAKMKADLDEQKRVQAEAQKKIDDENARIKAEQDAAQKKIDDAKAKIESDKKVAKDKADRLEREEKERIEKAERVERENKERAEKFENAKRAREEAERLAEKEAVKRGDELHKAICMVLTADREKSVHDLIEAIYNEKIPYVRIDWAQV